MSYNTVTNEKQETPNPEIGAKATEQEAGKIGNGNAPLNTIVASHSSLIIYLAVTFVMLTWPWAFFGAIWAKKGIQLNNHAARVVQDNPHVTNYLVTFIGTIFSLIMGFLLSSAVTRLAQERYPRNGPVTVFDIMTLSAFKHRSWPWGFKDSVTHLFHRKRVLMVVLIAACVAAFTTITSSITSLINPAPFNRTVSLQGTELDFASNDPDCITWFNETTISNNCTGWQSFDGLEYTNCLGENQLVDVLESGRNNILALLPNNSQSLTLSQLSEQGGLHLLGPIRGVLPIGPNGVPAFNTLQDSPLSDSEELAAMLSYNYTLENQGFISNVTCSYEPTSPIIITPVAPGEVNVFAYNGSCDGATQVLTNVEQFISINSNNTLTFWACKLAPDGATEPSYLIYLQGVKGPYGNYGEWIGNITCNVSPIQPAIFPLTYQSIEGIFSLKDPIATNTTTFSGFIDRAIVGLGDIIWEGQNWESNLVAESVVTFAVKSFNQMPYVQNDQYLQIFEAMIQGILEYQATYIRLIYSTAAGRPSSCDRIVSGSTSYSVIGWSVDPEHIGFLLPMTIINLISLVLFLTTIHISKPGETEVDRTDPRELIYSRAEIMQNEWEDRVSFPRRAMTTSEVLNSRTV